MASITTTITSPSETCRIQVGGSMNWLAARKREHDLATMETAEQPEPRTTTTPPLPATSDAPQPTSPNKPSKLLSLPPELRNEIYLSLFPVPTPEDAGTVQRIKPDYRLPGLLLSCKQIYSECIGMYYANSIFRCLEEESTVNWLVRLPSRWLELVREVRYDTRWMIFVTPFIPVPGAEGWLVRGLIKRLTERGFDVNQLGSRVGEDGAEGRLKVSFYGSGGVIWTDKPGLIDVVRGA